MARKKKPTYPQANIGCGEFYADGWVNVDITKEEDGPQPDIVASADDLPFTKNSLDRLYAGHFLEHIDLENIPKVLDEFSRVLKEDGVLVLVGPDLTRAELRFPEMIEAIKHGDHRWEGDKHLWESRESTTLRLLADNGWKVMPIDIESEALNDWPVTSRVGWQFAVAATKLELPEEEVQEVEQEILEGTIVE